MTAAETNRATFHRVALREGLLATLIRVDYTGDPSPGTKTPIAGAPITVPYYETQAEALLSNGLTGMASQLHFSAEADWPDGDELDDRWVIRLDEAHSSQEIPCSQVERIRIGAVTTHFNVVAELAGGGP